MVGGGGGGGGGGEKFYLHIGQIMHDSLSLTRGVVREKRL